MLTKLFVLCVFAWVSVHSFLDVPLHTSKALPLSNDDKRVVLKCVQDGLDQDRLDQTSDVGIMERFLACGASESNWFYLLRKLVVLRGERDDQVYFVSDVSDTVESFYIYTVSGGDYINFNDSRKLCARNFGYLAEINTEEEFRFLQEDFYRLRPMAKTKDRYYSLVYGGYAEWTLEDPGYRFVFLTHPNDTLYQGHWETNAPNVDFHYKPNPTIWMALGIGGNPQFGMFNTWLGASYQAYLCEISKDYIMHENSQPSSTGIPVV